MPSGRKFLYCCQLDIVILVPTGRSPWLAVSLIHSSISLRSVDCDHPSEGSKAIMTPAASKRLKTFNIGPLLLMAGLREEAGKSFQHPEVTNVPLRALYLSFDYSSIRLLLASLK